jgi:hypothetical protein
MATKAPVKKSRVTKKQVIAHRVNAKKDHSPIWEGTETMTAEEFGRHWRISMSYYRLEFSGKDLKPKVIDWMGKVGYDKDTIKAFKETKDHRCNSTMGGVAACLLRGMPEVRADWNEGRNSADWLKASIKKAIEEGALDKIEADALEAKLAPKAEVYVPTIQERLRDTAGAMSEELDIAIDDFSKDPDAFDPKAFKIPNLLRGKGAKAAHARLIKQYYLPAHNELLELASGQADEQLKEGYSHLPRKNVKKLIEFYEAIMTACDQLAVEAKALKKPRAKKIVPAEKIVAKLKYLKADDSLGISSVSPTTIIGAQYMFVYNAKARKIGMYIASTSEGFGVKGTSITNFTEKSTQKTVRKPAEQLKAFKDMNTQKRMQTYFEKDIKTTEVKLNGRFNEDTVILKVYK